MHHSLSSRIRSLRYPAPKGLPILEMAEVAVARDRIDILYNVNLKVHAGEIYGLLGPNGAGKSTVVAVALGLLPRCAGTITVVGLDPASAGREIQSVVGWLPERLGSLDCMTAREYLSYFARLRRGEPDCSDIDRRLEMVGLEPGCDTAIGTYSRGMAQRLGLARALVADPKLLILEHPTDGLDPEGRRRMHDLLRELATRRSMAVLLCTHLLDEAEQLCSRIGILVRGRTVVEGTPSELRDTLPKGLVSKGEAMVRSTCDHARGDHDLLAAGWPTMEVAEPRQTLEEFYLEAASQDAEDQSS